MSLYTLHICALVTTFCTILLCTSTVGVHLFWQLHSQPEAHGVRSTGHARLDWTSEDATIHHNPIWIRHSGFSPQQCRSVAVRLRLMATRIAFCTIATQTDFGNHEASACSSDDAQVLKKPRFPSIVSMQLYFCTCWRERKTRLKILSLSLFHKHHGLETYSRRWLQNCGLSADGLLTVTWVNSFSRIWPCTLCMLPDLEIVPKHRGPRKVMAVRLAECSEHSRLLKHP